jgi:hypothetical protein
MPATRGYTASAMTNMMEPGDIAAEGVVQAMELARDELRLSTATDDQLTAAAAFLARALAQFPNGAPRDARRFDAVKRLETAGKVIGAELARRAFA